MNDSQDTDSSKITKKNDFNNTNNGKNVENEHQSKKSALKKKVFVIGDSMVNYIQG